MNRPTHGPGLDPLALDEDTVERLLAGDLPPDRAPAEYAEVAAVLAATVAAPAPEELAGQAAALAELKAVTRACRPARTRRTGRPARRRRVGLAVVVVALSTAGAAVAATGHLSGPIREATRNLLTTVGATPPATTAGPGSRPAHGADNAGTGGPAATGQGARTAGTAGTGSGPTAAAPVAGAAKDALCHAFMAGQGAEQGKKADAAAFEALARAAGGADQIPAFCQATAPDGAKPKKDRPAPPSTPGGQQPGQSGPPPGSGGGNQGQGGPPHPPPAGR